MHLTSGCFLWRHPCLIFRSMFHICSTQVRYTFLSDGKRSAINKINVFWLLHSWVFLYIFFQGVMVYHREIANYFNQKGVSVIFLFRRNLLGRIVSVLANAYDKDAKQINGTHKSHVHSREEVSLSLSLPPLVFCAYVLSCACKWLSLITDKPWIWFITSIIYFVILNTLLPVVVNTSLFCHKFPSRGWHAWCCHLINHARPVMAFFSKLHWNFLGNQL